MTDRDQDVERFLTGGHVFPPTIESKPSHPLMRALAETLRRLPDDAFDRVEDELQVIVDSEHSRAINVPFERPIPPCPMPVTLRLDTVVVFQRSLSLSHESLVGLLAHEIAHSFVEEKDHFANEKASDDMAIKWGFEKELKHLRKSPPDDSGSGGRG